MQKTDWAGVFAAITTPFMEDGGVDERFLARHVDWLVEHGVRGIVALGSLGEGATLRADEKERVLEVCRAATAGRAPLVAAISGLATDECTRFARAAERIGCDGLMVLPAYVYRTDPRETAMHVAAIFDATPLSCMLYNNPIAYGTDFTVRDIEPLAAAHANLHAVKESSGDVRRLTALRAAFGTDLALFAGLDDMAMESAVMGADGWIAGLVNAMPEESVRLFAYAREGRFAEAKWLYDWFLPLLRFDTLPKFVQLIKLVQAEVGMGSERVRPPRLELEGEERAAALRLIEERLAQRSVAPRRRATQARAVRRRSGRALLERSPKAG